MELVLGKLVAINCICPKLILTSNFKTYAPIYLHQENAVIP